MLRKFFLKGTLLTQLAREMTAMKENAHQIRLANKRREQDLPALQQNYEDKCNKFAQYEKTRQVKKKLEDLSVLYVWSQVQEARRVSLNPAALIMWGQPLTSFPSHLTGRRSQEANRSRLQGQS